MDQFITLIRDAHPTVLVAVITTVTAIYIAHLNKKEKQKSERIKLIRDIVGDDFTELNHSLAEMLDFANDAAKANTEEKFSEKIFLAIESEANLKDNFAKHRVFLHSIEQAMEEIKRIPYVVQFYKETRNSSDFREMFRLGFLIRKIMYREIAACLLGATNLPVTERIILYSLSKKLKRVFQQIASSETHPQRID